ncbi:MAG: hypothetical protein B6U76_08690 [Desulfurococcales archaeon ex4484_217_2]|nr:MAG: hypothetical protein B6U76_08690 [Desulfurococcales archaeon ex4484_217_2]
MIVASWVIATNPMLNFLPSLAILANAFLGLLTLSGVKYKGASSETIATTFLLTLRTNASA